MKNEPCIRFGMRISPKISENPAESRNKSPPSATLFTPRVSQRVIGARSGILPRAAGERLSWLSSGLPWFLVSQDGVEDGEEFAGDRDEGDHFGLAGGAEAVAEDLEDGVVTGGDEGGEEEGAAHAFASAADHALALPLAGLAGVGGAAREPGDLL